MYNEEIKQYFLNDLQLSLSHTKFLFNKDKNEELAKNLDALDNKLVGKLGQADKPRICVDPGQNSGLFLEFVRKLSIVKLQGVY